MKFVAVIQGKTVPVEVERKNGSYSLTLGGKSFTVDAVRTRRQMLSMLVDGESFEAGVEKRGNSFSVSFYNDTIEFELFEGRKYKAAEIIHKAGPAGPTKILAPMPGKIIRITVAENSHVNQGDSLMIMEAMIMQNELKAPRPGRVRQIHVKEGEAVSPSQLLLVLE